MNIMKRSFLMSLIILSLIFSSFPTSVTASAKGDFFSKSTEKNNPKLGPSLNSALYKDPISTKGVERVKKDKERLHVYVEFDHPNVIDVLDNLGKIKNLNEELGLAEITLSASEIEGLLDNPNILSIREVMKPMVNRGYSMTEAFYDVGGQGISSYLKLNSKAGDNIKIGVISDGVGGLDNAISRGEIPSNVVILSNAVGGAEGTAMLEVIHDLAPNAQLFFHDCGESSLDFINSVNALAAQGVDIIVDDIVYLDEPFFEDSNIAKHINQLVTSTGILYISSAGNFAQSHVQSVFRPVLRNAVYEHDFSTTETGVQRMPIAVPAQSSIVVMLQWNEPFNNSAKDLELAVCSDNSTTYCFVSDSYQLGVGYSPIEYVELINTGSSDTTQYVTVYSENTLSALTFEIYLFGGSTVQKYGTRTDSTFGHSTAANVLSIAAIDASTYSVYNPSLYSSQGPFTMVNGTTRNKPDFTAYDCVEVSGSGGFPNTFCGTSAASAHIGAMAALLKSNNPTYTRTQLIDALKAKSYDLSTIGYDYQSGHGLVHLGVYGPELTIQKTGSFDLRFTFDKPGKFTSDNTSVLSVLSTSVQSYVYNGVTYYNYLVSGKALIDGTSTLRFTTTADSKELYRHKIVVSNRLLDFAITDSTTAYLQLNQSMKFGLYLTPENANNASFTYTSSSPTIATVDTAGNIVAKTTGSAKITIKHSATGMMVSGTVKTGILSTGLSILPAQPTVTVGQTIQLSTLFTPSNVTYKEVKWSSYSAILSVDANGLATGVSPGTVTVYADSVDGRSTAAVSVTVVEPLTAIAFEKPQYTYYFSGTNTMQLYLMRTPANSNETGLLWQSSNPQVMEVNQEGILTIKSLGTSEITVSGPRGLFASTIVNVEPQAYTNFVNVERNGVLKYSAFSLKGTYGQTLTLAQLRTLYDQAMGSPAGVNVYFFERIGDKYFGITSDYVFLKNETLLAVEVAIPIKSLTITDVSIASNILSVNGRFEPNRPNDIRYRYTVSDPTVLRPILDSGSSVCTLEDIEFACLPGSFEILKSGTVSLSVESFDGKFKDTIRIQILEDSGNYYIDNSIVRSLNVTSVKSDSLELKWSAVELAAGYEIYRSTAMDGPFEKVADVVSALQYTDTGRLLNQPTYYKVRAYMLVGEEIVFGDYSEVVVGRTRPDPLTNVSVTHLDRMSLQLNVYEPNISVIQWAYSSHPEGPFTELSESNNQHQILSYLAIGMTYYFKVRYAVDTSFGRVYSDYSAVILQHPIPKIPTLTVTPVNTSKIRLQIAQEPQAIYQFYSIKNGKEELIHQSNMYIFEYTDIGPGEEVGFKARVFIPYNNKDVYSLFTPVQTIKMAPETVRDLHPSVVEISSITVAWSASPKAAGYEVSQSLSSGSGFSVVADTTQLTYRATGLKFNTTYYYRVRPYVIINNTKIYGDYSSTTNGHTQVPYVLGLNAKSFSYNSNRIEWTKVDLASGYDIYYSKGTSTSYVLLKSQSTVGFTHTALATNTKYNYKIRAYYLVGTTKVYGQFSLSVSATPLTSAPVTTVTSTSYNSLRVSWPAVAGANGYEVSYSLSETGTYTKLPLTTALVANIPNTITNRTYYIKVRAYRNVNYVKIYGDTALVTGKSLPSAPTLTLTSGGYDTITASWGSVAGASGYQLYVLEGTTYRLLTDTTALSFVDKGKITGKDTTYKVLSYRWVDNVKVFSKDTIVVGRALPAIVTNLKVSGSDVTALTLTWTAVPGATGYEISQATTSTGTYTVVGNVSTLTYVKTGLSFNMTYYYKVRAYRLEGSTKFYGPLSSAFSGKTALTMVSGVTAGYTSYNTNRVSWNAVNGASGYAIYYSKGTSTTYSLIKYQTATTLTHTSLITNTKYNYKVRAYKMVGTTRVFGPYSTISSSTPLPMPPVISVASAGYNSVNVSWPAVAGASGYEVGYSTSANGTYTLLPLTTKTSAIISNLSTNVPVYVRVRTYRTVSYVKRYGNYSTVVSGVPIPSAPTLTLSSAGFDSIKIAWAAVAGASGYEVYILDGTYRLLSDTAALSVVDGGKVTGVETKYKVRAYRWVNNIKVYGPETLGAAKALPSLAADFKISLVDIASLSMTWSPVSGASGYEISQATTSTGTYTLVGDVSGNEFKKTGLTFNRTYYYKIRAYTTMNNVKHYGPLSVAISAKTVPSPVVLTVTPLAGRVNSLTWQPINGAAGYQIYYSTGTSTSYSLLATVTTNSYSHKALVLGRRYNYRVRAYRMSGTTRIYGDYSPVLSAVAIN